MHFIVGRSFLAKVIEKRMSVTFNETGDKHTEYISRNPEEIHESLRQLSNLYREWSPLTFLILEKQIIHKLYDKSACTPNGDIRTWPAGYTVRQEGRLLVGYPV